MGRATRDPGTRGRGEQHPTDAVGGGAEQRVRRAARVDRVAGMGRRPGAGRGGATAAAASTSLLCNPVTVCAVPGTGYIYTYFFLTSGGIQVKKETTRTGKVDRNKS